VVEKSTSELTARSLRVAVDAVRASAGQAMQTCEADPVIVGNIRYGCDPTADAAKRQGSGEAIPSKQNRGGPREKLQTEDVVQPTLVAEWDY